MSSSGLLGPAPLWPEPQTAPAHSPQSLHCSQRTGYHTKQQAVETNTLSAFHKMISVKTLSLTRAETVA